MNNFLGNFLGEIVGLTTIQDKLTISDFAAAFDLNVRNAKTSNAILGHSSAPAEALRVRAVRTLAGTGLTLSHTFKQFARFSCSKFYFSNVFLLPSLQTDRGADTAVIGRHLPVHSAHRTQILAVSRNALRLDLSRW